MAPLLIGFWKKLFATTISSCFRSSVLLSRFLFFLFFEHRIEPLQLEPCIRGSEPPVNSHLRLLALLLPGCYFPLPGIDIRETTRQALPFQHTQRALGHVQPGAMRGRVGPCNLTRDPPGFRGCEALVQTGRRVGLQVIPSQAKRLGFGIILIDQQTELRSQCTACLTCRHPHCAPPREGLDPDTEARRPLTRLLVVLPGWLSGLTGKRAWRGTMEGLAGFIQTDLRALGIIRPLLDGQDVFQLGDAWGRRLGNAPGLYRLCRKSPKTGKLRLPSH